MTRFPRLVSFACLLSPQMLRGSDCAPMDVRLPVAKVGLIFGMVLMNILKSVLKTWCVGEMNSCADLD